MSTATASAADPVALVVARLNERGCDPRATGADSHQARCPAHDGSRHNLDVSRGDDGRALVFCHHCDEHGQGCSTEAIVAALGLTLRDLFPYATKKSTSKAKGWRNLEDAVRWVATKDGYTPTFHWVYTDDYAVARLDGPQGKTFRPFYRDLESGRWRIGDPKRKPLPLLNSATLAGTAQRIFWVEGEKCAGLVEKLGLPSTTTAHGAKSPQRSDFGPVAGKEIVLLPDVGPAGEGYRRSLIRLLRALTPPARVKTVRLPGLVDDGDDIEQWLEQRQGIPVEVIRAELEQLADAAPWDEVDPSWATARQASDRSAGDRVVEPINIDDIRARAQGFTSFADLCRASDFHTLLARLEVDNPAEGAAIHADLAERLKRQFRVRDFKAVMGPARRQAKRSPEAGDDASVIRIGETIDDPHRLAKLFVHQHCMDSGVPTLVHHRDAFYLHDGTAYRPYRDVSADLTGAIKDDYEAHHERALMQYAIATANGGTDEKPPMLPHVTTSTVNNAMQALRSETALDWDEGAPCWIGEGEWTDRDPLEILPAKNCLVHLPTLETLPHTPRLFSPFALSFEWFARPPKPERWLRFLNEELWPGDPQSVRELQKWFGLSLTLDTSYQRILMLIGPPRSGKGTILRVLKDLIGEHNTTNPSLPSLARSFGLWGLLDKSLCIFSDAHALGNQSERAIILEYLLKISGEDNVTIDRKFLEPITTKLTTRLMFVGNQPPAFRDASGALVARLVPLQLYQTWKGREDRHLTARLTTELPGILRYFAVEGLELLKEDGGFRVPESARSMLDKMTEMLSPAYQFGTECLDIILNDTRKPTEFPVIADVFAAYCEWCIDNKYEPGNTNIFGRNLNAAYPHIRDHRPRTEDSDRKRRYGGIALNSEGLDLLERAQRKALVRNNPSLVRTGPQSGSANADHLIRDDTMF